MTVVLCVRVEEVGEGGLRRCCPISLGTVIYAYVHYRVLHAVNIVSDQDTIAPEQTNLKFPKREILAWILLNLM